MVSQCLFKIFFFIKILRKNGKLLKKYHVCRLKYENLTDYLIGIYISPTNFLRRFKKIKANYRCLSFQ